MKKKLCSILMLCFLAVTIVFAGCSPKGLKDNPPTDATVTSNGGMSVVKGDYLYFVNGYVDSTTLTKDDNKENKVTKSGIYRTKLDNGEIQKDKDGFLTNADRVVSKVVGFNNGGFFIIDDYIIYATPYMKLTNKGELQTGKVEFHRINIDGTKDKVIYTTDSSVSDSELDWKVCKIGNNIYLLLKDGSSIVTCNVSSLKSTKKIDNVSSYAILSQDDYIYSDSRAKYFENYIIYTRAINSEDNIQSSYDTTNSCVVCELNIATGETKILDRYLSELISIQHVNDNTIYYTKTSKTQSACLYKKVLSEDTWKTALEIKLASRSYSSYYFVDDYGVDLIIASDDQVYLLEGRNSVKLINPAKSVLGVFGNYVYCSSDDGFLIRFDLTNRAEYPEQINVYNEGGLSTLLTNSHFIDFDNRRIYVYAQYTAENGDTNYYLNYIDENFIETPNPRFVGVFEGGDVPAKPEQPEEPEYEGDEVEYIPHID